MHQTLGWRDVDEEGRKVDVEATRERNHWTFSKRAGRREDWQKIDPPRVADWENLLDVLQRKYQRRRCAWRDVEQVQKFLDDARKQEPRL